MSKRKAQRKLLLKKLKNKYRMSILNETTFEEKVSYRLSPLNVITGALFTFIFLGVAFISVIVFTPLRELIPGYTDTSVRSASIANAIKIDSLQNVLEVKINYINTITSILKNEPIEDSLSADANNIKKYEDLDFSASKDDSLFREAFEEREKYNIASVAIEESSNDDVMRHFFAPVRGILTQEFDSKIGHYGVDVVTASDKEPIKAVLAGTVISATWTSANGYVITVQHDQGNLVSVYKHNSVLLKEVGDKVRAGDSIAIIGNTGEETSGPHLHFELWKAGKAINPETFIIFEF